MTGTCPRRQLSVGFCPFASGPRMENNKMFFPAIRFACVLLAALGWWLARKLERASAAGEVY